MILSVLACGAATAVVASLRDVDFAYRNLPLHVSLETTATLVAAAAGFLLIGRFRRTRFLDELLLGAGLTVLALSNLAFAAAPAIVPLESNRASAWSTLLTGTLAALIIAVSSQLPRRRLPLHSRWPLVVYAVALAATAAASVPVIEYQDALPRGVTSSLPLGAAQPNFVGHPVVLALQIFLAVLYLVGAVGFVRRHRSTGDELSGWLAIACVFAGAARVNYFFFPSLYSSWVYTGDVFRLGSYLVLLVGTAREISSYWASMVRAVALEERRQLAREVHDGLAQEIAFIARNVRLLREEGFELEAVDRILDAVARAREESRRVVSALATRPDPPLDEALADAARHAAARYGASVELRLEEGVDLGPSERETVVRIASEAVTNAARHSGAGRLQLNLERRKGGMRLEVVDDGVGFARDQQPTHGFGLITMRERAEALGARFRIRTRHGRGTRVELEL